MQESKFQIGETEQRIKTQKEEKMALEVNDIGKHKTESGSQSQLEQMQEPKFQIGDTEQRIKNQKEEKMALEVNDIGKHKAESGSQSQLGLSVGGRHQKYNVPPGSMEGGECSVEDESEEFNFNDWVKEQLKTIREIAES